MTTLFQEQMCLVFGLLDFKHFENLCIDKYECKPCLFVKLPVGTRKTLVTLISNEIKTTKLAKKFKQLDDQDSSTTRQSISNETTIIEVVHEIKLDDQNPITRQLIMFKNQTKINLADYC